MQNEGTQEAVCEGHVREVERLMMRRDSPKCETDTMSDQTASPRLMLRSLRSTLPHCGSRVQKNSTKADRVADFLPDTIQRFKAVLADMSTATLYQVEKGREGYPPELEGAAGRLALNSQCGGAIPGPPRSQVTIPVSSAW